MKVLVLLLAAVAFSMSMTEDDMIARGRRGRRGALKKLCSLKKAKVCVARYGAMGCPGKHRFRGKKGAGLRKIFKGCARFKICAVAAYKFGKAYCQRKCYTSAFTSCLKTWIGRHKCNMRRLPRRFKKRCARFKSCGSYVYRATRGAICHRRHRKKVLKKLGKVTRGLRKKERAHRRRRRRNRRKRRRREDEDVEEDDEVEIVDEDEDMDDDMEDFVDMDAIVEQTEETEESEETDDVIAFEQESEEEEESEDVDDVERRRRRRRRRKRVNCKSIVAAKCIGHWAKKYQCRTRGVRFGKKFLKYCRKFKKCGLAARRRHPVLCSRYCHSKKSKKCIMTWAMKHGCRVRRLSRNFRRACGRYYSCGKAAKFVFPRMCTRKFRIKMKKWMKKVKAFKKFCAKKAALKCVLRWGKKHGCRTKARRGRRGRAFRKFAKKCKKFHACGKYYKHKSAGALCLRRCHSKKGKRCVLTWILKKKCSMSPRKLGGKFIRRCRAYKQCGKGARKMGYCTKKARKAILRHVIAQKLKRRRRKQARRRRRRRRRDDEDEDDEEDVDDVFAVEEEQNEEEQEEESAEEEETEEVEVDEE